MKYLSVEKFLKTTFFLLVILTIAGCSGDDNIGGNKTEEPVVGEEVPVAVDDNFKTIKNQSLQLKDLLDNDTVYDYARVSEFDTDTEKGGSVEDNRDGTYKYTPPKDFIGEDTFGYTVCDNAGTPNCSSATVIIDVTAATLVASDDSYETREDNELGIRNHLSNDELVEDAYVSSVNTEDTKGTVVLENDGSITYSPESGFAGDDVFTYTVCDDQEESNCDTATITVTVVDEGSPVAKDDQVVIDAGRTETIIDNILDNDDLTDDAVLISIDVSGSQGTIELQDDGSITYRPSGFVGEDSFSYTLCDDDSPDPTCVTAKVTVTVIDQVSFNIPSDLADYYADLVISQDEDLNLHVLSELVVEKHTTILSYGQRHNFLYDADEDLSNSENVILIYSGESRYWREYNSGTNSYSPQTFNTEHVYPQSRLTKDDAVTDLHHLRVADEDVNSLRSNFPFTDGSGDYELINENSFYPGDEWKGDVARMLMYVNIRYGEGFHKVGNIDLFLKWNAEDPVSDFEKQRNEVIESAQGNRNPFIDNPYLATLIWGGDAAENTWD